LSCEADGTGEGTGTWRVVRAGEFAVDGVVGAAGAGVLRPERVGGSGAAGDEYANSYAGSAVGATELRVGRGGKLGALEEAALNDVFGAGARIGIDGGMFSESSGFGTRSESRINRKSRPNS
jgi:hypothetical protein